MSVKHRLPRYWSCPGCGVLSEFKDLDGFGVGICWRHPGKGWRFLKALRIPDWLLRRLGMEHFARFSPEALINSGLTGDKPAPFQGPIEDWMDDDWREPMVT